MANQVLATDNFNRADEAPLASPWASITSEAQMNLTSNVVVNPATANDAQRRYTGVTFANDQYILGNLSITGENFTGAGVGFGLRANTGGTRSYYRFVICNGASNNIEVAIFNTGYTLIGNATRSFSNGDKFEFRAVSSTLSIWHNDALVTSFTNATLSSGQVSVGYSGSSASITHSIDNVEMGNIIADGSSFRPRRMPLGV